MSAHRLDHVTVLYRDGWYIVGLDDEDLSPRRLTDVISFQVGTDTVIFKDEHPLAAQWHRPVMKRYVDGGKIVEVVDDSAEWDNGEIWHMWAERWAREMAERTDEEANNAAKAAESAKARHEFFLKIREQATR